MLPPFLTPPAESLSELEAPPDHTVRLLEAVAAAFAAMLRSAARDGVPFTGVSGYRDLDRQTTIWNRKHAAGIADGLDPRAAIDRVMEYSAPPGWSRHHWGTDVDLVGRALATEPRLEPEDWSEGGPCHETGEWLREFAGNFGFFRPYVRECGGYRPEPWHWSFAPIAELYEREMETVSWPEWLVTEPFAAAGLLVPEAQALFTRFVRTNLTRRETA